MKFTAVLGLTALMLAGAGSWASAEEQLKVRSGGTLNLGFLGVYNTGNCGSVGKPDISFKQPAHGTLTARWTKGKNGDKGACGGRLINGYHITYKSKPGYRGKDSGTVRLRYPAWENSYAVKSQSIPVSIDVK
jgi:hypothetical protein